MKNSLYTHWIAAAFLAIGLIVSYGILAYAQTTAAQTTNNNQGLQGITFPVPELGNCGSEEACRAYCNDTAHIDACVSFAQAHGLMNKDEASQAEKFKQALQSGGGPGGCTGPADCQTFCSNQANLEVCVKFAKDHGVRDQNVDQGEKILAYLKSGGHMPGNCTSQSSCQAYCGDFSHAEECFNFAKHAGITQTSNGSGGSNGGEGHEPTPEQMQKFLDLAKSGQTPGGCASKDACESYCQNQAHLDECLTFGVKAGFMTQAQADTIRGTGGKGPGGCNSQQSCQAYCNDPTHQDDCFKFAEEHGFINKNDRQQIQNGEVQIRSGLEQAPPEIVACIKASLDPATFAQIESGQLVPGPDIGRQIQSCFGKFGHHENPSQMFSHLPDQVLSCVKDKLGSDFDKIQSGAEMPTPEMADTIRVCFQSMQMQQMGPNGEQGQSNGGQNSQNGHTGHGFQDFLQTAPPGVLPCLQQALGSDFDKFRSGSEQPNPNVSQKIQSCFNSFHPMMQNGNMQPPQYQGSSTTNYMPSGGYHGSSTNFVPPPGYLGPPIHAPVCPSGQYWNGNACQAPPQGSSTPYNGYNNPPPQQLCQQGQYWNGNTCVQNNYPSPGSYPSSTQSPSCQSGQYWNGASCVAQTTPPPPPGSYSSSTTYPSCAAGQFWNGSSCINSTMNPNPPTCLSGQYWNGNACVNSTPNTSCPSGQYWNGTSCISSTIPNQPPPSGTPPPASTTPSASSTPPH